MKRCENGHYYDETRFSSCTFCAGGNSLGTAPDDTEDEETLHITEYGPEGVSGSEPVCEPVVGWLVAVAGPETGRDFRLREGRNYIGRAAKMDIAIFDDPYISRLEHCSIIYDSLNKKYYAMPGNNAAYVNGRLIESPEPLSNGDMIAAGTSMLQFTPFYKGECLWPEKPQSSE